MSEENAPEEPTDSEMPSAGNMAEENAPEEPTDSEMPSAGKQLMVMGIIVIGITVVLGGGVWLSMFLK